TDCPDRLQNYFLQMYYRNARRSELAHSFGHFRACLSVTVVPGTSCFSGTMHRKFQRTHCSILQPIDICDKELGSKCLYLPILNNRLQNSPMITMLSSHAIQVHSWVFLSQEI